MKVICDREKLREGLALANNVIPAKSTIGQACLIQHIREHPGR